MNLNIPLHSLSPKELEIMQYVHEHSDAIVSMSIQTFAQEINYSTSTVIRFCRKLGFSGFPEFKYFLKNLNIQKEQNPVSSDISVASTVLLVLPIFLSAILKVCYLFQTVKKCIKLLLLKL